MNQKMTEALYIFGKYGSSRWREKFYNREQIFVSPKEV